MQESTSIQTIHRAALALLALTSPAAAGVIAALPPRPGQTIDLDQLTAATGDPRRAGVEVSRLHALGVLSLVRQPDGVQVSLDRDQVAELVAQLCADLPGERLVSLHPGLRPWVTAGRFTGWPTQPAKAEAAHLALADLFVPGEELTEDLVNQRLGQVLDDVAQERRALVDRGLLRREPGSDHYRVPEPDQA